MSTERIRRRFAWPHRYRLLAAGGCLIVVLLWIGAVTESLRSRQLVLQSNDRELSSLASALAEQTARSLQGVEFILRRTSGWALDAKIAQDSQEAANRFLREEMAGVPQVRQLDIVDATGRRIATTLPGSPAANVSQRAYFRAVQRASGNALVVSEPLVSMVDGRPTFAMASRLEDEHGRFAGAVVALIENGYFRDFYRRVDSDEGTGITLLREDGAPVVSSESRKEAGGPGRPVLSARKQVPGFQLTIDVTRDEALVLQTWRVSTIYDFMATGALSLLVVALGIALMRRLQQLGRFTRRLQSSQQRWRAVFDNAPAGIMLLRRRGRYLATNPAFQRMVGYSSAELKNLSATDITHPEDVELTRQHFERLLQGGLQSVRFEKRYQHRDGYTVWADVRLALVTVSEEASSKDPARQEDVIVATVEDVTQRREDEQARRLLESQLRQSQKLEALGTFAGGIAHDFNNILGAIVGYGELALQALADETPQQRYVAQVLKSADRARSLVERILTFSRSGLTTRQPVHVQPVVHDSIEAMKVRLPAGIRLEVELNAPEARIEGDPAHIDQLVMNLCANAVHAMPAGGTLRVVLDTLDVGAARSLSHVAVEAGHFVRLAVSDSGVGMAPDLLERIFNPFFTTRKAGEGTGLGLALVDGIVREYGGGIDVTTTVGAGSRFELLLPTTDSLASQPREDDKGCPYGEGQAILLVDDEEALVRIGEERLAELGYEPAGFVSSNAAWQAFRADPQRFDAVVTDQTMPGTTGVELARMIRSLRADIPIILVSGFSSPALEAQAREAGVNVQLRKPLPRAELARTLKHLLPDLPPPTPPEVSTAR
ncbi:PAS domain S-box protein [Paraburkholderia sp. CNPSo 3274]|uniref:PAS domain S-box protein n=1 Tax=Paraburkholderia sp. CNPSo 3274 TaxID=2940932 RepID=UPI0020B78D6A|nr:PAS domain S-box protein [Paraburkholderia sp. CNPSo 3274]MCP3707124.1 PAS domain S-box protein [Paraburkholderia sp. CNPSo 3274]